MSVLRCCRKDCKNIMCDWISPNYGYLCNECLSQLKSLAGIMTIKEFINTPKAEHLNDKTYDIALTEIINEFEYRE